MSLNKELKISYPTVGPEFAKEAEELKLATSFRSGRSNLVPTAATVEAINLHRARKTIVDQLIIILI